MRTARRAILAAAFALGLSTPAAAQQAPGSPNAEPAPQAEPKPAPDPASIDPAKIDLAYGAYQRGLFLTAFREATERVERDPQDAAAMTLLGELHAQGAGAKLDPARAAEWYRLAHARGDINATYRLGMARLGGEGVPKDEARGRELLEEAAKGGQPLAAYNLALLLLTSGEAKDLARAGELLRQAAEAEIPEAQQNYATLLRDGRGVPADPKAAFAMFTRAARNGDIAAEVERAIMLFNGEGVAADEIEASRGFRRAAFRGNAVAQNRLARLYAVGRGVTRDPVEAAAWHLMAAGQGLSDSWLDTVLKELSPQDRARARELAVRRLPV